MTAAGMLEHRARFERRVEGADDGYGNTLPASWTAFVTRWVSFQPDLGNETEQAGRLQSTVTGRLKIRRDTETEAITAADRVVFVAGHHMGRTAQIRSIIAHNDGATFEMRLEFGVAE